MVMPTGIGARLASPAWLLRGAGHLPGRLELTAGHLAFTAHDRGSARGWQLRKLAHDARAVDFVERLRSGRPGLLFREKLGNLTVTTPWYCFHHGLVVHVGNLAYRITFRRPFGADRNVAVDASVVAAPLDEVGRRWLQALHPPHASG